MLYTDLYKQNSKIINLYFFIVFNINSCFYNKAKVNLNKYIIYIIFINKVKYIIILIFKYNIKLLIKKYK